MENCCVSIVASKICRADAKAGQIQEQRFAEWHNLIVKSVANDISAAKKSVEMKEEKLLTREIIGSKMSAKPLDTQFAGFLKLFQVSNSA